jgi:hypothetical protein
MSGKGAGKKRNRAAQGEPHGYQERPTDVASKVPGKDNREGYPEKTRIIDKLRDLEQRRRDREGSEKD